MSDDFLINLVLATLALPIILMVAFLVILLREQMAKKGIYIEILGLTSLIVSATLLAMWAWVAMAPGGEASGLIRAGVGWTHQFEIWKDKFSLDVHIDALSLYFILLANIVAFAAAWIVAFPRRGEPFKDSAFFYCCLNGFYFSMLMVPILDNLIGLWIAIEFTTLFSALVVGFYYTPSAWEAAWKYLIITSAGIGLALLGTMFLAHAIKDPSSIQGLPDSVMNWTKLLENHNKLEQSFVELSFLFILVGYGTKAGLAPMHTWLPDGHGEAPAAVSALLSGVLLKLALYAILRFSILTNASLDSKEFTSNILLGAGVFSLLIAAPLILKRNRFKRVLAYHSVEHMGIICFGLGIGTPLALAGALLHTLNHAVTKSLMFLAYGNVISRYKSFIGPSIGKNEGGGGKYPTGALRKDEDDADKHITGILRIMPWTASLLLLGGFALVGAPPFGIFVSELMILLGAMQPPIMGTLASPTGLPDWAILLAVAIFMLTTTLIFFGLTRHLSEHLLGEPPKDLKKELMNIKDKLFWFFFEFGPLLFLGVFVVAGVLLVAWLGLINQCVAVLQRMG